MKVFISHSSDDKWVARQISKLLIADGHSTFLDEKDIKTGDSIDASIQEHLKDSDHLLLLLSPSSISSHWVFIELGGAKALGKKVVPVLFHLGANEIPSVISQLLARDINELDKYFDEIKPAVVATSATPKKTARKTTPKKTAPTAATKQPGAEVVHGTFHGLTDGDRVKIVEVERLTEEDKAKSPKWVPSMDKYSGVETEVVGFTAGGQHHVYVAADDSEYMWASDWVSKFSRPS